jgi:hypothetical protein
MTTPFIHLLYKALLTGRVVFASMSPMILVMTGWIATSLALLGAVSGPARAPTPLLELDGASLFFTGSYRFATDAHSAVLADSAGDAVPGGARGWQRLRLSPSLVLGGTFTAALEYDVVDEQLLGASSGAAADLLRFDRPDPSRATQFDFRSGLLRRAALTWDSPIGRFEVGHEPIHWGLGLLVNDGAHEPVLGLAHAGDLVERAMFATRPLQFFSDAAWATTFTAAIGLDLVYRDTLADFSAGERAWQRFAALRYDDGVVSAGLLGVYRTQRVRGDDQLQVWTVDAFGTFDAELDDARQWRMTAAGEGVVDTGTTWLFPAYGADREQQIIAWGGLVRAAATYAPAHLSAELEAALASGDDNPYDGTIRALRFHPDVHSDLVLMRLISDYGWAAAAARSADQNLVAEPSVDPRRLATNGALTNIAYVRPAVTYQGLPWLSATIAVLVAAAPSAVVDPVATSLYGGAGRSPYDAPSDRPHARLLGWEASAAIAAVYDLASYARFSGRLHYAHAVPGAAFDRWRAGHLYALPPVDALLLSLQAEWLPPPASSVGR